MIRVLILIILFLPSTLLAAEPFRMVYYDNYYPRSFLKDGKMQGVLVDIVDEILAKRMGLTVKHEGYPWKRAQMMVRKGAADAFVTVPTDERREYTLVSAEPVLVFAINLLTSKTNPRLEELQRIQTIPELQSVKLVDYQGNGWAKKNLQGLDVTWLPESKMIFPYLLKGRADAILASSRTVYDQKRLGYGKDFVVLPLTIAKVQFHLCISKTSHYKNILSRIDEELVRARQDGTLQKLEEAYY